MTNSNHHHHRRYSYAKTGTKTAKAASPAAVIGAIVVFLRSIAGDALPWGPDQDVSIVAVLGPLASALFTFISDKLKHDK